MSKRWRQKSTFHCHNDEYFMLVDKLDVVILAITACNLIHGNQQFQYKNDTTEWSNGQLIGLHMTV
jgi:hypothetical protein